MGKNKILRDHFGGNHYKLSKEFYILVNTSWEIYFKAKGPWVKEEAVEF
jgi:hypothetical protein